MASWSDADPAPRPIFPIIPPEQQPAAAGMPVAVRSRRVIAAALIPIPSSIPMPTGCHPGLERPALRVLAEYGLDLCDPRSEVGDLLRQAHSSPVDKSISAHGVLLVSGRHGKYSCPDTAAGGVMVCKQEHRDSRATAAAKRALKHRGTWRVSLAAVNVDRTIGL